MRLLLANYFRIVYQQFETIGVLLGTFSFILGAFCGRREGGLNFSRDICHPIETTNTASYQIAIGCLDDGAAG